MCRSSPPVLVPSPAPTIPSAMPDAAESARDLILSTRLLPNFSTPDLVKARAIAHATLAAGMPILEYTNRHEESERVFAELARHLRVELPGLLLGAGTVTTPAVAERFIAAGAGFIVGPNFHAGVAAVCASRRTLYIPGCATPTEVAAAIECGAAIVKIFPAAQLGGPAYIKGLLGPFPNAHLMPSGGITTDPGALREWFAAGAACVSIGSELFPRDVVDAGNWSRLSHGIAATAEAVRPAGG